MDRIVLENEGHGIRVSSIAGCSLRNAIPRESVASIAVPADKLDAFTKSFEKLRDTLKSEYKTTDPELMIELTRRT